MATIGDNHEVTTIDQNRKEGRHRQSKTNISPCEVEYENLYFLTNQLTSHNSDKQNYDRETIEVQKTLNYDKEVGIDEVSQNYCIYEVCNNLNDNGFRDHYYQKTDAMRAKRASIYNDKKREADRVAMEDKQREKRISQQKELIDFIKKHYRESIPPSKSSNRRRMNSVDILSDSGSDGSSVNSPEDSIDSYNLYIPPTFTKSKSPIRSLSPKVSTPKEFTTRKRLNQRPLNKGERLKLCKAKWYRVCVVLFALLLFVGSNMGFLFIGIYVGKKEVEKNYFTINSSNGGSNPPPLGFIGGGIHKAADKQRVTEDLQLISEKFVAGGKTFYISIHLSVTAVYNFQTYCRLYRGKMAELRSEKAEVMNFLRSGRYSRVFIGLTYWEGGWRYMSDQSKANGMWGLDLPSDLVESQQRQCAYIDIGGMEEVFSGQCLEEKSARFMCEVLTE